MVVPDGTFFILTGNDDIHKSFNEFEIHPDPTRDHRASFPLASEKFMFPFFLALYNGSQVSIVALWATCLKDVRQEPYMSQEAFEKMLV